MANEKTPNFPANKINSRNNSWNNFRNTSYSESYKRRNEKRFRNDNYFAEKIKEDLKNPEIGIKRRFKRLERDDEKTLKEVERIIVSRKARKIEKAIVVLIYIIVLGIAGYFILASFFPDFIPGANNYIISANDSKILNSFSSFYIDDQSVLGNKKVIGEATLRSIISSKKFNFIFKPKENIPEGKKAGFELNLLLNKDKPGNIYVNDNLIFPSLENYKLIAETNSDYIYVNNEILPYVNNLNNGNINLSNPNIFNTNERAEDFLYKNLPGASVWSTRKLDAVDVKLWDYSKDWINIPGTFRGDLKLVIYVEDNIDIDFTKQDLNMYLGEDKYNVSITGSDGKLIHSKVFNDDGDKTNSGKLGKEQNFSININELENGIYYIHFDDSSEGSDISIKNINMDSNKVLIAGNFLPWDKFEFYTKASLPKKIGFYYWWTGKEQIISIIGTENTEINLNKDWFSKRYDENLTKGEYTITMPKGYLWIYDDFSSPLKSNWFDIPPALQTKFDNPVIILIDKYNFNKDTGFFRYKQDIDPSQKKTSISLRTLEINSASFKDAKLILK